MMYKLKLGDVITTIPTIGFNIESVQYKNVHFTVWDVGGRDRIRALWRHYYVGISGIIFVVDSNDRGRMDQAKEELDRLQDEDLLRSAALLVLANKQDLPNAMSSAMFFTSTINVGILLVPASSFETKPTAFGTTDATAPSSGPCDAIVLHASCFFFPSLFSGLVPSKCRKKCHHIVPHCTTLYPSLKGLPAIGNGDTLPGSKRYLQVAE
eukprot:TRINITY_DN8814_c0_g1_i3.p1 TRINITY_DN8814_c0_g1~~TRINITY_DN8814_c0_g1_i3.p1  ORF type:complete len:210 (+),score=17.30 TRINITY_DN8814_c0_g1_i3:2-631(+)